MFLAREMYPENSTSLYYAYMDATQRRYRNLILDLSQDKNDRLRFRTNIFVTDPPSPIIYAPMENEASEIKLSRSSRTIDGLTETA